MPNIALIGVNQLTPPVLPGVLSEWRLADMELKMANLTKNHQTNINDRHVFPDCLAKGAAQLWYHAPGIYLRGAFPTKGIQLANTTKTSDINIMYMLHKQLPRKNTNINKLWLLLSSRCVRAGGGSRRLYRCFVSYLLWPHELVRVFLLLIITGYSIGTDNACVCCACRQVERQYQQNLHISTPLRTFVCNTALRATTKSRHTRPVSSADPWCEAGIARPHSCLPRSCRQLSAVVTHHMFEYLNLVVLRVGACTSLNESKAWLCPVFEHVQQNSVDQDIFRVASVRS